MSKEYHDRFTEASEDLEKRSGFICESCKKTYVKEKAVKKDMTCCNRTMKELVQESFGP